MQILRPGQFMGPGGQGVSFAYIFDGVNDYAVRGEDWTPGGVSFEVDVSASNIRDTQANQCVFGGGAATEQYLQSNSTGLSLIYAPAGGQSLSVALNSTDKSPFTVNFDADVNGSTYAVGDLTDSSGTPVPTLDPVSVVGALNTSPAQPWYGPVWALALTDNSPIQGTYVKEASVGTIPSVDMTGARVSCLYIMPAGDESPFVGFLSHVSGVLAEGANTTDLVVNGIPYTDWTIVAGEAVSISFKTTGGTLTTMNSGGGLSEVIIQADI